MKEKLLNLGFEQSPAIKDLLRYELDNGILLVYMDPSSVWFYDGLNSSKMIDNADIKQIKAILAALQQ